MSVDEDAEHAEGAIILDETHSAHVSREIVNDTRAFEGAIAGFFFLQIELLVIDAREKLIPFVEGFDVHRTDVRMALLQQVSDQVASDESASAANDD